MPSQVCREKIILSENGLARIRKRCSGAVGRIIDNNPKFKGLSPATAGTMRKIIILSEK
jgi:hypothetical protein